MFLKNYQSDDYSFSYNEKTIKYTLTNIKEKICITISGKDAFFFQKYISLINKTSSESKNLLIEEAIGFYIGVCVYFTLEDEKKIKNKRVNKKPPEAITKGGSSPPKIT